MVTIIAEAGLNHGGSFARAVELAEAAKAAGADIVKFQTFIPEKSIAPGPDRERLAPLALTLGATGFLAKECERIGIEFCSTPDDLDSLKFLVEQCGVKRIKLGSGSLLYRPLVEAAVATELPVLLSTGMATMHDIFESLGWTKARHDITLMQCVSLYPCPPRLANVRALDKLRQLGYPVGYSDHTAGCYSAMLAVALGAAIIEKHLCLHPSDIDAPVSLHPTDFRDYVLLIREAEILAGDGVKKPSPEEAAMIPRIRKTADGLQPGL